MDYKTLFNKQDLIPAIVQDASTLQVLMLGYVNAEALRLTLETSTAWFWSRSRGALWNKGETSGNFLIIKRIMIDCDNDTILMQCQPEGPVCHTGNTTCFFTELNNVGVALEEHTL